MIVVVGNDALHTQQVVSMSFRLSVHWEDLLQSQLQSSYVQSDEDSNIGMGLQMDELYWYEQYKKMLHDVSWELSQKEFIPVHFALHKSLP